MGVKIPRAPGSKPGKRQPSRADAQAFFDKVQVPSKSKPQLTVLSTPVNRPLRTPTVNTVLVPRQGVWDLHRDGITQGLLANFSQCPEKARLAYLECISGPRTGGALAFGSIVHEALDLYYSMWQEVASGSALGDPDIGWSDMEQILHSLEEKDRAKLKAMPSPNPNAQQEMEENYGMAHALLKPYLERWEQDMYSIQWVALEEQFRVPYSPRERLGIDIPDIPMRGKRDGVYLSGGKYWLFETKTKARIEEEGIVDTLSYNLQVMFYLNAMRHDYGKYPGGVLYNLMRRPQLRRTQKESLKDFVERYKEDVLKRPDHYFIRYHAIISRKEQEAWLQELDSMMWRLIMWYYGAFHHKEENACMGRKGTCEYIPICSGRGAPLSYGKREHIFPELDGEDA
jgi:hypothetical protein